MRIAWFSPFPPVRTGIADCSAELVAALRCRGHAIDAYPAESAHDFPWTHRQRPYDLIVYQFGNSSHHDYAWAYALRYPGLVILHDTCLHHARAAFLLRERRAADYRAEFAWSHPEVSPDAAELAVAGLDSRLFYQLPLTRALFDAARMVATHAAADRVPVSAGRRPPARLRLGHGVLVTEPERARARRDVRTRYGIAEDAVLFGVFGGMTPEKRIAPVLGALEAVQPYAPSARLLLAGATAAHFDAASAIEAHGLGERVVVTGYLPERELTDHLAACDVSLNLRWPTAGEISGAWLRALAAGVPTVITALAHLADVPSLDPRTWQSQAGGRTPVTVAVDILDEDHSLRLAMRRLALDPDLRAALGRSGQAYWQREHSLDAMVQDYERLFREVELQDHDAARISSGAPAHLRASGRETLQTLLEPFGVDAPL
jgi:glycosyltransferase involved in cell wall biosynthesis